MPEKSSIPVTLRTLQIGNDWPTQRVGGLNRYFSDLLRHLPAAGTAVHGMVVGPPEIERETNGVVQPFALASDSMYRRVSRARQAALATIDHDHIDLIASHFAIYSLALGPKIKLPPMVVHFHGPWAAESNVENSASLSTRVKRYLEQSVYQRAERFIVLSQSFKHELVSRYHVREDKVGVVPGGIDVDRFNIRDTRAEAREKLGWSKDRPVLLVVRRLVRRMGLETLIEAMKTVVKRHPDVLLYVGGSGPLAEELVATISVGGLDQNVKLLGRISEADLPLAYRAADMTIVPTQSLEGFGMITLESLASGTPTLVTPVGGLPETIAPFAAQCIFKTFEAADMADLLTEVIQGSTTIPSEQQCRDYALTFAWPLIAKRVRAVYDQAR